jgi:hypothetical protein
LKNAFSCHSELAAAGEGFAFVTIPGKKQIPLPLRGIGMTTALFFDKLLTRDF